MRVGREKNEKIVSELNSSKTDFLLRGEGGITAVRYCNPQRSELPYILEQSILTFIRKLHTAF